MSTLKNTSSTKRKNRTQKRYKNKYVMKGGYTEDEIKNMGFGESKRVAQEYGIELERGINVTELHEKIIEAEKKKKSGSKVQRKKRRGRRRPRGKKIKAVDTAQKEKTSDDDPPPLAEAATTGSEEKKSSILTRFLPQPNTWVCSICTCPNNQKTATHCKCCEAPKKVAPKSIPKKKLVYKPLPETPSQKKERLLAKYFNMFKHELRSTYDSIDETLKNNKWFEEKAVKWAKWAVKKIMIGKQGREEEKAADIIINKTFKEKLLDKILKKYSFQVKLPKEKRKKWFEGGKRVFMPVRIDNEDFEQSDKDLAQCAYTTQRGWMLYEDQKPADSKIYWYNIDCKNCSGNLLDPNDRYYINGEELGLPKDVITQLGKKLVVANTCSGSGEKDCSKPEILDKHDETGSDHEFIGWEFYNDLNPETDKWGLVDENSFDILYEKFLKKETQVDKLFEKEFITKAGDEEEKEEKDTIYFIGARELRKIAITFDHTHDATDAGRATAKQKSNFPKIKTKAYYDVMYNLVKYFKTHARNNMTSPIEQRCYNEMVLIANDFLKKGPVSMNDAYVKKVFKDILSSNDTLSMYITCSIPHHEEDDGDVHTISIIPSGITFEKLNLMIKKDCTHNRSWLLNQSEKKQIHTNDHIKYFARLRHKIMGLISKKNPQNLFPESIRQTLELGKYIKIHKKGPHIYVRTQADGESQQLALPRDPAEQIWLNIFKEINNYKKIEIRPMLTDMLTQMQRDATLIMGLSDAGLAEGPIKMPLSTGGAPVALPPTVSLNDHAESMHAAQRKHRRIISVENIAPNFHYQQEGGDRKRMLRCFPNRITYSQAQNPNDPPDVSITMERNIFKAKDRIILSYLFGPDFGELIENRCGEECNMCKNLTTAMNLDMGKIVNNVITTPSSSFLKNVTNEKKPMNLKTGGIKRNAICECHTWNIYKYGGDMLEDTYKNNKINLAPDDGGNVVPFTGENLSTVFKTALRRQVTRNNNWEQQQPKPCSTHCGCEGLCSGNIIYAKKAAKKIKELLENKGTTRKDIVDTIMMYPKEFYCLLIFIDAAYERFDDEPNKKKLCQQILTVKVFETHKLTHLQIGQFLQVLLFTSRLYIYGGKLWYIYEEKEDGNRLVRSDAEASDAILMKYYENMKKQYKSNKDITKSSIKYVPEIQLVIIKRFLFIVNQSYHSVITGRGTHTHGVNLTITEGNRSNRVKYEETTAGGMMENCGNALAKGKKPAYTSPGDAAFNAYKLSKWSGDAHQNFGALISGYLLVSSDEISFMSTRLANGCKSRKGSWNNNWANHENLKGNEEFFHMFFSGEKMDSYETLYLHMFRLSNPTLAPAEAKQMHTETDAYLNKLTAIINKNVALKNKKNNQFFKNGLNK